MRSEEPFQICRYFTATLQLVRQPLYNFVRDLNKEELDCAKSDFFLLNVCMSTFSKDLLAPTHSFTHSLTHALTHRLTTEMLI